jgi:hypothetical protein
LKKLKVRLSQAIGGCASPDLDAQAARSQVLVLVPVPVPVPVMILSASIVRGLVATSSI